MNVFLFDLKSQEEWLIIRIAVNGFLCIAALVFPFSVAATNVGLGIALVLGVVSGLWWMGAKQCWHGFRSLSIAFLAYFLLLLAGLSWSQDFEWGLHVIGRQWFWLLIPILVATLSEARWRRYFLLSLSAGLTFHLLFCVLQLLGIVSVAVAGSGEDNATGHIGHIGFGLVYGIWASWLLLMGLRSEGRVVWLYWALSCWSYIMIFAARGRSGYIVAFVLAMSVLVKWYADRVGWKRMIAMIGIAFVLLSTALALGPARERLQGTWLAVTGNHQSTTELFWEKNGRDALMQRFQMWTTTLDIYRLHPVAGVGTGGLPDAVAALKAEGRLASKFTFSHPHNQYLLALVRWGPLGLILLSLLLYNWMREGWQRDWHDSEVTPLIFLTALALAIHGLSSTAMEEHFSALLAVLLLGAGLSDNINRNKPE